MAEASEAMKAMARRIAWEQWPSAHDFPEREAAEAAALAAIQATTERTAALNARQSGEGEREAPWGQCKIAYFSEGHHGSDEERVWDAFGSGKNGKLPDGWEFCESGISGASGYYVLFDVEGIPNPRDGDIVRNALADLGFMSRAALRATDDAGGA